MKVITARTAGFCMGVRHAVELALSSAANCPPPVHTLGPLIHNNSVVRQLEEQGIIAASEIPDSGTVIIRAHGIPPETEQQLRQRGLHIIDATCKLVKKSHHIIDDAAAKGLFIIIAGDAGHAEVIGLAARANAGHAIIATAKEAEMIKPQMPFAILAQTTFSQAIYSDIIRILQKRFPQCQVYNTICLATEKRQEEAKEIIHKCDALVVVGGHNSANTRRLVEVGAEENKKTFHVESASELVNADFAGINTIGLTAGASTPQFLIDEVRKFLEEKNAGKS